MAILKTSEIRDMGDDELQEKLNDLKKETIEEKGQIETGGFADNPGLPDDLDPMDQLARAEQNITVKIDSRTYNKEMTIVEGFGDDVELGDLSSRLKSKLACGGTVKDGHIELQGNHLRRMKEVLVDEGFDESNIEVKR